MINKAKDFPFTQLQGKIELNDSTIEKFQADEPTKPNAYVEVKATGKGLHYQWYIKLKDTEEWKEIGDSNVSRYYIGGLSGVSKELNGAKFKCKVSNSKGSVTSDEVTLTVAEEEMPVITAQPTNQTVDPSEYDALTKRKFARYVVAVNGSGSGGGTTTDEHNKGWFTGPTALPTTGENGDYAIVGTTDTVWVWDSDTNKWVDTGATNTVKTVNNIGPDETGNISLSADNISDLNIGADGRTITIGTKSVSLLTPDSVIAANKIDGTVNTALEATKAYQDGNGENIADTYAKTSALTNALDGKQDISNLVTAFGTTPADTKYPSEKLVFSSLETLNNTTTTLSSEIETIKNTYLPSKANKATTLSGYGITDVKIEEDNKTITLGEKSITPLTVDSTIAANKIEGTVASATKTSQDAEGNIISTTYAKSIDVNTSLSTKQDISNLVTSFSTTTSDTKYPSEKLVHSSLGTINQSITGLENDIQALSNNKADKATTLAGYNIGNAYTKDEVNTELDKKQNLSNLVTEITAESLNTTYPSSKAVYDYVQTLIQQLKETNNLQ